MSKLAIITGADGGMGTEITRAVAQAGYHVIMLCYTLFKGEERKNQLILETGNKEIEVRQVHLSSMASVTPSALLLSTEYIFLHPFDTRQSIDMVLLYRNPTDQITIPYVL